MLQDYCRIIEENHELNEELKQCDEVARENFNLIAQLELELREKNTNNNDLNAPNVDCQSEIEYLQAQLEKREKIIKELFIKMNDQHSDEPSINKPAVTDSNPTDLDDASQKLRDTIKDLESISGDIEKTLNSKDMLLQEQQRIIDELRKQLEVRPVQTKPGTNESESICMSKLKEVEKQNHILANQTMMLEEQLAFLMEQHNQLMENNNDLINSIIVCQKEICKYEFEEPIST